MAPSSAAAAPLTILPSSNPNPTLHSRNNSTSSSSKKNHTWLLTPGNSHFAKNRSSFSTYHRAPTRISGTKCLGVGTVELTVRRGPDDTDNRPNKIVLENVLHIPGARCNGLCLGRWKGDCGGDVEVVNGDGNGNNNKQGECRCLRRASSEDGREDEIEEGEVGEDGSEFGHPEALWYGEGYHGGSRVVLWGDEMRGNEEDVGVDVDGMNVRGVDASAEELSTLYTRVRQRSLN
ncbi:hypothetical protein BJY04DRAFT_218392 [Aspergillus karnatakaensis]|uniref:uncharacterized protein n=1 Tax=Aspergillus karnatakaensis TaxID=1810916 RepID=UPI003CCE4210